MASWRLGGFSLLVLMLAGCERGCAKSWFQERGVGEPASTGPSRGGLGAQKAVDCPDGLARCSGGMVEVSRLTEIPLPCNAAPEKCTCPWDRAAECEHGCVADELEVVLERDRAPVQLCAPGPDAGPLVRPLSQPGDCDDTSRYRCAGGLVVSCPDHAVVAACLRGCAREGADIGIDEQASREAAFAILCSR